MWRAHFQPSPSRTQVLLSAQVGLRSAGADDRMQPEKRLFAFSIAYLFILFGAVVADHWLPL